MPSGCVYPHPFTGMAYCVMQCVLYLYRDKCIHIGVGFDVVAPHVFLIALFYNVDVAQPSSNFSACVCGKMNRLRRDIMNLIN